MQIIPEKTRETVDTLRKHGRSAAGGLRGTLLHTAAHTRTLFELFRLEIKEYGNKQAKRVAALVAGILLLLCGYLVFCALACTLLGQYLGLLWGMGIVCLVHFALAGILITLALKQKPCPMAPATRQELENDLQCLRILLNDEKGNS